MNYRTKTTIEKLISLFYWLCFVGLGLFLSYWCHENHLYGCSLSVGIITSILFMFMCGKLDELYWYSKSFKKTK